MMVRVRSETHGHSRSFGPTDPFPSQQDGAGDVLVLLGDEAGEALSRVDLPRFQAVLVELGDECLGDLTGEDFGREGSRIVGFARYRIGPDEPTRTIELVVQPHTDSTAIDIARSLFEAADFTAVVCNDASGRILDRLMRPHFNLALDALDRRIADASALDSALTRGLGYPRGPITILESAGLAHHLEVTARLYAQTGQVCYLPPRRARVAGTRQQKDHEGEAGVYKPVRR